MVVADTVVLETIVFFLRYSIKNSLVGFSFTDTFVQSSFTLSDLNQLHRPQLQHSATSDQLGSPRLSLPGVLLPVIDEQRLPSDMDRVLRQVQEGVSAV